MADSTITFIVLGAVVVLFVSNRVPVAVIAVATALSLWATGVLEIEQATAGFGDPTVIFIAALFVVSEALDATGVTVWVGQQLIDRAGTKRSRIVLYMIVVCALLTAFITPNASVAALVPVVVAIAVRRQPADLAAVDPAGVLGPCRLAAGPHREPGQRRHLRRGRRSRRRAGSGSSNSRSSASRC